jgi:flagellar hook-associated protein 1 FlgK
MGTGITTINSLGLAGMQTAQTGMANVATNVSGAAVDGFHRREVHPLMSSASTNPLVQGGTVIIDSVMRSYSSLLSMQYLSNHGKVKQASALNVAAEVIDKMLVDESTGLTDVFNGFFTSASDLSADPASGTARAAFSTTSKELTDRLRSLAATIEETRRQALVQMTGVVDAVNEKAEALARVNQLIQASSAYGKPLPSADLLDERDRLTGQLVDLTGATVYTTDSGQATLRFDGLSLVDGNQAARLAPQYDSGSGSQAPLPSGLVNVYLPRGEGSRNQGLGGLVATLGGSVLGGQFGGLMRYAEGAEDWLKRLDKMALSLVDFGNPRDASQAEQTWYTKGIDSQTQTLQTFSGMFQVAPNGYDSNKWLDDGTGELVILTRSERPSLSISSTMISGDDVPWSQDDKLSATVDQSYIIHVAGGRSAQMREWSDWVSSVSSDLSKWRAEEASFTAVHQALEVQVQQISGVDLDQEATDLLKFQQIYQANSAVIQAAMRMFDTLISATGR